MLIEMHTVIVGVNGNPGLIKRMDTMESKINGFCLDLQMHEALPAHAGAANDLREIKEILAKRSPGRYALKAWHWVLGVVVALAIAIIPIFITIAHEDYRDHQRTEVHNK